MPGLSFNDAGVYMCVTYVRSKLTRKRASESNVKNVLLEIDLLLIDMLLDSLLWFSESNRSTLSKCTGNFRVARCRDGELTGD